MYTYLCIQLLLGITKLITCSSDFPHLFHRVSEIAWGQSKRTVITMIEQQHIETAKYQIWKYIDYIQIGPSQLCVSRLVHPSYIRECDPSDDCRIFEQPITVHELSKIIQTLPNGKSGSSDNITYENLKYGGETLTAHLTQLFR